MKKIIALVLVFATVLMAFCACGNKDNKPETTTEQKTTEEAAAEEKSLSEDSSSSGSTGTSGSSSINFEIPTVSFTVEEYSVKPYTPDFTLPFSTTSIDVKVFEDCNQAEIENIDEATLNIIIEKKDSILNKLADELQKVGVKCSIDNVTGEVSLDSSVLFGGDSAVLSATGKDFLNKFIKVYCDVVLNDEYDGFISKIYVEGHIAPVSGVSFDEGMPLSEERAKVVKDYCLSGGAGVASSAVAKLSGIMEARGLSNSNPVKDGSGNVDMAASRRVTFRFTVNVNS